MKGFWMKYKFKKKDVPADAIDRFILQSQSEDEAYGMHPPRFALSWILEKDNAPIAQSEWTPKLEPSIAKTLALASEISYLKIRGKNLMGCTELDLAVVKYSLVKGFGYIAEKTYSNPNIENIIGMWINLDAKRQIRIMVNGHVAEVIK
jgi:hypothetical protein